MWVQNLPPSFNRAVVGLLREPLAAVGFDLTPEDLAHLETGADRDHYHDLNGRIREQLRQGPTPGPDLPSWLREIDRIYSASAPRQGDSGRQPEMMSEIAAMYTTFLSLAANAASMDHLIQLRSNNDSLLQNLELQWMQRLGLPRNAEEFERLVALLPRLPEFWHQPRYDGDLRIEQPLRRQFAFSLLVHADIARPGTARYTRLLEVIEQAPDDWFGSPGLGPDRSRRPGFWIGYRWTPPEVRALLRHRTNDADLQEDIDKWEQHERKQQRAEAAMRSAADATTARFISHPVDADIAVLGDRIAARCPVLAAKLEGGVPSADLVGLESALAPLVLPGDVAALWRWAGGAGGHNLFGPDPWLGPRQALVEYEGWIEVLSEESVWSRALFPLACTGQFGWFVQLVDPDSGDGDQSTSAVWEFDLVAGVFEPVFGSIQAMVRAYAGGIDAGLFIDGSHQLESADGWPRFRAGRAELNGVEGFDRFDPEGWPPTIRRHRVGQLDLG